MNATLSVQKIRSEARLMFSLLDAFECSKTAENAAVIARWREAKQRVDVSGDYESEATLFHDLLTELESAAALSGTWIERRWRAAQARIAEED